MYVLSRNRKNIGIFCLKIFNFSVINFSVYLNRHVFVMSIEISISYSLAYLKSEMD